MAGDNGISVLENEVRAKLDEIVDPCSLATADPLGLAEMGLVEDIRISGDGKVAINMRLTSPTCVMVGYFRTECNKKVGALPGVNGVEVSFDEGLDWDPSCMSDEVRRRRAERFSRPPGERAVA